MHIASKLPIIDLILKLVCLIWSNVIRLYEELGWESLSDRLNDNRIFQIYKIISNTTLLSQEQTTALS